ncbi:MAG: UDP-3-O-acyl-N-acetylglucosamine deacetylase [Planctomycetia bacterium]|nr:UDP-3-O-acyl-N-acetylglucosamine deacetylase [Planctomycetia bacterium]
MRSSQYTIATPVFLKGFGYWGGQDVQVSLYPAAVDTGVVFRRTDLAGSAPIPGKIRYRSESPHRTTLVAPDHSGASVGMVEHLLAALTGLGIDNVEIHCDAPELPGLDGSSLPIVNALRKAGRISQSTPLKRRWLRRTVRIGDGNAWIEGTPIRPGEDSRYRYEIHYGPDSPIRSSVFSYSLDQENFETEVSPARTFILLHEAQWLQRNGYCLRVQPTDVLIFDATGPIGGNSLRFPDECARHKLLDLIGDLSLAGHGLTGAFSAYRSGHELNAAFVREILSRETELLADTPEEVT